MARRELPHREPNPERPLGRRAGHEVRTTPALGSGDVQGSSATSRGATHSQVAFCTHRWAATADCGSFESRGNKQSLAIAAY